MPHRSGKCTSPGKNQTVSKDFPQAQVSSQGEELNRARADRENKDREMMRVQEQLRLESAKNQKLERGKVRHSYSDIPTIAGDPMLGGPRMHSDTASSVGYSMPGYRGFGESLRLNRTRVKHTPPVYNPFRCRTRSSPPGNQHFWFEICP